MIDTDKLYREGQEEADRICSAEDPSFPACASRHYTRASYGVAMVLRGLGRNRTWRDLSAWHNVLCGATGQETISDWAARMEADLGPGPDPQWLSWFFDSRSWAWRLNGARNAALAIEHEDGIRRAAAERADELVKRENPRLRRNTKAFKLLVGTKALELEPIIKNGHRANLREAIAGIDRWMAGERAAEIAQINQRIALIRSTALDVKTLRPGSPAALAARQAAQELEDRIVSWIEHITDSCAEEWKKGKIK